MNLKSGRRYRAVIGFYVFTPATGDIEADDKAAQIELAKIVEQIGEDDLAQATHINYLVEAPFGEVIPIDRARFVKIERT